MEIHAHLPEKGRDLRLDLFRGIANWAIYLDHIPDNIVNWITTRNYGFSDAADLFVFISGYTEDKFRDQIDAGEHIHFLPKPFSLKQLAGKVKEVLRDG